MAEEAEAAWHRISAQEAWLRAATYDALSGPKSQVRFTQEEGSDWHCDPRSPSTRAQRVFDWLGELLDRPGPDPAGTW
jgi:hypothetical protein